MDELRILESFYSEFLFVFIRIMFFIGFGPVFSATQNLKVKIGLATAVTIMLMGIVDDGIIPSTPERIIIFAITEALIGISMALILKIAFAVTEVAGHAMSQAGGLSFAVTADPQNGVQIPVIGNFLSVLALLLYISMDGIPLSIEAMSLSYAQLPPGNFPSALSIAAVYEYSSVIFITAFMISLPIVTAVTMANLAFGIMTRTAPQINILAIGLPISLSITLVMVGVGLEGFMAIMVDLYAEALSFIGGLYGR